MNEENNVPYEAETAESAGAAPLTAAEPARKPRVVALLNQTGAIVLMVLSRAIGQRADRDQVLVQALGAPLSDAPTRLTDFIERLGVKTRFADYGVSDDEASRMVARLNAGDVEGAGMTGAERRDLQRATELVAPHRVDVPTACAIFAEAADLIGHENLVAAAKAYARRAPVARTPLPVGQAVLELLEAKTARGRSARTLQDLRRRLGRFAEDNKGRNLGELTTAGLQCWLDQLQGADGKPLSALSRRNFAVVVGGLFEFHRRRGVLPDNPARDLERESVKRTGEIEFWSPLEAGTILAAVSREALPALVLAMFAGLRSAEVCRITWRDVNLDAGVTADNLEDTLDIWRQLVEIFEREVIGAR
jgi:hypothetical protein